MKNITMAVIIVICTAATVISWSFALRSKPAAEKQFELIQQAGQLTDDGIYIKAVPLLEEAAGYDAAHTATAEEELKKAYIALMDNRGYARKYMNLLEKQMGREDAGPEIFIEAAKYQLSINARKNALTILRDGIGRTEDAGIAAMYESERYAYEMNRTVFEAAGAIHDGMLQVCRDGKWGIADTEGTIIVPCIYDRTSTFYRDRAIVMKDGDIYAVDRNNNKIAVTPAGTQDFRNLSENRTALLSEAGWRRATADFETGSNVFEDIGTYRGGFAAARTAGKWGVVDTGSMWLVPAQYDDVIRDELGRCYAQGAVFVRDGEQIRLIAGGELIEGTYQDARPFSVDGYAAVCKDGCWGFIDTAGNVMIDFLYDDALSFSGNLAAVEIDGCWGYINRGGAVVIEMIFSGAGSFCAGSAPVLTERGWQLITLVEYKSEKRF